MKTNIFLTGGLLIFIISLLFVSKSFSGNSPKLPQEALGQAQCEQASKKITLQVQKTDLNKVIFVRATY